MMEWQRNPYLQRLVIKAGKAGLNGGNNESDIKPRLAFGYVYEKNFQL